MSDIFTTEELATLSIQVDEQLRELSKGYARNINKGETQQFSVRTDDDLPPKQRQDIEDNAKKGLDSKTPIVWSSKL
jgi:hypothetical protein